MRPSSKHNAAESENSVHDPLLPSSRCCRSDKLRCRAYSSLCIALPSILIIVALLEPVVLILDLLHVYHNGTAVAVRRGFGFQMGIYFVTEAVHSASKLKTITFGLLSFLLGMYPFD